MDVSGMVTGAGGLIVAGLLVYVVTRQAARGSLDVNGGVGIKTTWTKSSSQAWEVGHRAALPWVRRCAVLCLATAVLALVLVVVGADDPLLGQTIPVALVIVGYGGLLVLMVVATTAANRAVRSLSEAHGR